MTAQPTPPRIGPGEILPYAAAIRPDKTALVTDDRRLTYRELDTASAAVAAGLAARGVRAGDVVSLYGQNTWQWIVAYHGVLRAGAVVNPANVMLTGPELTYVLRDCGATAIVAGVEQTATAAAVAASDSVRVRLTVGGDPPAGWERFASLVGDGVDHRLAPIDAAPTDLCSIGYTSGTAGHPKGAMQSQESILLNCAATATMHARTADDVTVTALPAAHVYGNVAINSTFLVGGTVVLMERFHPARALQLIASERATVFEGVPAMYSMLLADRALDDADLTSLTKSTVGGQTFSPDVAER